MSLNFRFAIVSDPHIALPETIWNNPSRFHLVEVSIPALEIVLQHLEQLDLDFLLLPGDLTQHGELANHQWLQQRLKSLPFPAYVVPGNHDFPSLVPPQNTINFADFPYLYQQFGYQNPQRHYYTCELIPGVQIIALNSNQFDAQGQQIGCLDEIQWQWLERTLAEYQKQLIIVMIHHNVVEHLPGQSHHELGKRYMLGNAHLLRQMLRQYGVKLIFTGHLHVQDIAEDNGLYEITTGSLVSYPHPYRILQLRTDNQENLQLTIESHRINIVPGWDDLGYSSREWMGDRSLPFMLRLLTSPPLNLALTEAEKIVPDLRYFWANIAEGDTLFEFPHFPTQVRQYFQKFGAINHHGQLMFIDNQITLWL